ncbi:MAG: c-type cytochrome [Gemmatimonadaceae bacterium]
MLASRHGSSSSAAGLIMVVSSRSSSVRVALALLTIAGLAGCKEEAVDKSPAPHAAGIPATSAPAISASDSTVFPTGPEGVEARRGFAILAATRDSMPGYVGAGLRCFSCHLDNGRRANAIPLTGVYARYPNYNPRDNRVISIQDRVNNCFRRSLAGRNIPIDGVQMNAIVEYLAVVSRNIPVGAHVAGEGMPTMVALTGDTSRGDAIYTQRCARCHGDNGQGIPPATPLWGARSYSVGASLARVSRAATFIRHNMPFDSAGVLSDQQAFDVAAYVVSHPRPDAPEKQLDFSAGGAPGDVPYNTKGHVAFNPPRLLPSAFR